MNSSLRTRCLTAGMLSWLALAAQPAARDIAAVSPPMQAPVEPVTSLLHMPYVGRSDPYLDPYLVLVANRTMAMHGSMDRWGWESGVALAGLMHAYEATGDEAILDYVESWTEAQLRDGETFVGSRRVAPSCATDAWPAEGVWHPNHATPAWAVLMLFKYRPEPAYRAIVDGAVRFLVNDACRVDGALAHVPDQLWDDTLIVSVPLLARYGVEFDEPELLDLAADEVLAHARRLQDPSTGLWYHGWHATQRDHMSGAFWLRGNGWAALAMTELLARLPLDHPQRTEVIRVLQLQLLGLIAHQDRSGLWHTVIDQPDYYLETSGSAAVAAAFLRAADAGWVDPGWAEHGRRARDAVRARVEPDGTVTGVSQGTGVQPAIASYNTIGTELIRPYGQGLYLVMGTAAGGR